MAEWIKIVRRHIQDDRRTHDDNSDRPAKLRFAASVGVDVRTLERWLAESHNPVSRSVLDALEAHQPELGPALRQDFPDFYETMESEVNRLVSPFYARVHEALEYVPKSDAFRPVVHLVLDLLVNHVDPQALGLIALIGQLGIPSGEEKASYLTMHAWSSHGTDIWFEDTILQSYTVGNGSLSALAVTQGELALYPRDLSSLARIPAMPHLDKIQSAAAHPIRFEGRIAGVIYMASTQPKYFTRYRREVVKHYARMLSLAFHERDFYSSNEIALEPIRDVEQQYLDRIALDYPGDTLDQLKDRAVQRLLEYQR